ncbi:J domain-containing protein [Cellvibrio japonicus]|uniref:DnaJ domain protein n=1 Tax=Cellvibrio japonicus (strain Ueda107) TaxID=498211 RepID=B3PES8_CELJU|nr:molecular chaperone DnaJ [Cellvibrio japonicus]ACE85127.1 DnaJ domain protein [Cellvibrio japonicus Ueda107]QEI12177.1 molecular chaperone DnaJ [Cellvibrio japonicus]QEI15751.1 molecular chaperone DnaJ [Cellvibrio japonicus]QEI19329.1 molecular chaperone DnaJ [Cellvibrio japonicus]
MLKILILAVVITLGVIGYARYKQLPPDQKRKMLWRVGTGVFLGVLVLLVITGRMHWVGAALGALLPFARSAFGLVMQALPLWMKHRQQKAESPKPASKLAIDEALEVLGLKGDIRKGEINEEMVNDAHRRLIQKLHPDRGGNDYLAAKINQARDLLIAEIQKYQQP